MKSFYRASSLVFLLAFIIPALAGSRNGKEEKRSELGIYEGYSQQPYKGFNYYSVYIPMPDSVRLAADVFLPKKAKAGEKFPAIIYLTRYVRSLQAKLPFRWLKDPVLIVVPQDEIEFFTSHGYACIIVDVRGSGASEGIREMEFSPKEVRDGYDIVNWIISQPWSDGKVASTGVSYVGTTAELLLVNKHPAVKACVPRSNIFDLYNHIMFPNGVRQGPFIKIWGETTQSLDQNDFDIFGKRADRLLSGINPVDGDRRGEWMKQVVESHKNNFDVYYGLFQVNYRDDKQPGTNLCSNDYSIHNNRHTIEESGTPIFRIGGWYDGALTKSVFEGMWNTANTERILVGPWDHGPHDNASPFSPTKELNFNVLSEILRFLDYYVKGIENGIRSEKKVNYFTVGEEKWKHADTWPPTGNTNIHYYFSADKSLTAEKTKVEEGDLSYTVDYSANSGNSSRWNSQTPMYKNGPTHYADRREKSEALLNFTTSPFPTDVELTGNPVATLYLRADAGDAVIFCYIEDVAPEGTITYVTEGLFRAQHRRIAENDEGYVQAGPFHSFKKEDAEPLVPGEVARLHFDLLPVSYLLREGHRLRISIAGADAEHFDEPEQKPTVLNILCTEKFPSSVILPFAAREKENQ